MKYIGRLLGWILLGVNGAAAALLFLSAYSPYIRPQDHPMLSCAGLAFPIFLAINLLFLCLWLIVYRKYTILPLLTVIGCWGAVRTYFPVNLFAGERPEGAIKILSYNTEAFANRTAHTKESPNPVLSYLAESDADIICLQECVWGDKLKKKDVDYALRQYPYKHHYSFAKDLNGLGCYSRYPILSTTPIAAKSNGNGSIAYRIKVGEDTLLVVNNHLESFRIQDSDVEIYHAMMSKPNSQELASGSKTLLKKLIVQAAARAIQAENIARYISTFQGQGVIACGDFNDSPISYARRVVGQNLKDAFVESGNGAGISYHENRFYFRIDHILLSKNITSYECTVDRSAGASDHYPIWCYISWK
ncbi:MAG: endonuclease/exonuclease/phosphatase family protein [Bacteroides sp.]|nr:endonuclease/exonuclease/phosphatase family protein [Bacteroides sp.]